MGNIAVFGGTFNPIHSEHIKIIKHLSGLDFIDRIFVIPTYIPPHKTSEYLADEEDRINMCRLATEGIEKVEVSDFEIKRKTTSYTYYTVEALRNEFESDRIFVVCGGDMAITLDTWHRYEELKKLCTFLVIDRPDTDSKKLRQYLDGLKSGGADIEYTVCVTENVSSSALRSKLLDGGKEYEIPKKVLQYINEKGLYRNEE
ncbi:MAG: nicotinate (nicotinamide) nucleotide adenylyltransferase [Acutalibacteraceae bacterium]|nr:nicotinate (nicotinamide) nucleotide adenylyltransferase [Acutalibacteraceae bacterium]